MSRKPIASDLENKALDPQLKEKLQLTLQAREFSKELGLNPKKTFLSYSDLKNMPTIWVVTAAEKFKLKPHLWHFPVVGALPYKGFFNKEDAESELKELKEKGYDVSLRTTAAFSSLGWFDDPIMPSTLSLPPMSLFNTVIHEITHTSLWIPNHVSFNETMANTIGYLATAEYFMRGENIDKAIKAKEELYRECKTAQVFNSSYNSLKTLYESQTNEAKKEQEKSIIFSHLSHEIEKLSETIKTNETKSPKSSSISLNNASFLAYYTYLEKFDLFLTLFLTKNSIKEYYKALTELANSAKVDEPFEALTSYLEKSAYEINNETEFCSLVVSRFGRVSEPSNIDK